jgi:non-specific serine/threonine protein kinase
MHMPPLISNEYRRFTLWPSDTTMRLVSASTSDRSRAIDRPLSLCLVLGITASTVLIRIGDFEQAERCIDEVIRYARTCSLPPFHAVGLCARGSLMAARGDAAAANQLLATGIAQLSEASINFYYPLFVAERAAALGTLGRVEEGLAEIDAAQRQAEASGAFWCMEMILRIKGELLAKSDRAVEHAAEQAFFESLNRARRGKALSLELRAAMSLARLWHDRHRVAEARTLLAEVYGRFTEGFETLDLVAAKELLMQLT